MDKRCGYSGCNRGFLPNEDHWNVDGVPCHITKAPGQNDDRVSCYWAYRHERVAARFPWPPTVFRLHWLSVIVLVFLSVSAHASMPKEGDPPTAGCWVKNGLMEPAIVYGIKPNLDEDGKPAEEYWVKLLRRPELHKNGRAVNIPQSEFLPYGEFRMVNGPQGRVKIECERPGNSGISAEH